MRIIFDKALYLIKLLKFFYLIRNFARGLAELYKCYITVIHIYLLSLK